MKLFNVCGRGELFNALDLNKDGQLDHKELAGSMSFLGNSFRPQEHPQTKRRGQYKAMKLKQEWYSIIHNGSIVACLSAKIDTCWQID